MPRIVVMAESAIDGVTLSERFDASDLDSEYLRARLFEPPVVGGWRCPSGRASWRRGVRCRRAQSRGRYEAIQPGRSRDGPVDDLRDRVEMIQKTQGALGRRGWREPPVEGRGAGFPSRGPQLACRRQPRRSRSWRTISQMPYRSNRAASCDRVTAMPRQGGAAGRRLRSKAITPPAVIGPSLGCRCVHAPRVVEATKGIVRARVREAEPEDARFKSGRPDSRNRPPAGRFRRLKGPPRGQRGDNPQSNVARKPTVAGKPGRLT